MPKAGAGAPLDLHDERSKGGHPLQFGRGKCSLSRVVGTYTKMENSPFSSAHNTDVDHGTILPVPAENAELNFSAPSHFHAMIE